MQERLKLVDEIVGIIISSLNLHFVNKDEVNADTLLMAGGLGLDSVDILEVVVGVEQRYGVKIKNAEQGQKVFRSVGTIADFVASELANIPSKAEAPTQSL